MGPFLSKYSFTLSYFIVVEDIEGTEYNVLLVQDPDSLFAETFNNQEWINRVIKKVLCLITYIKKTR